MKAVIIKIVMRVFALPVIYCATRSWHKYIRDGQYKESGWSILWLAIIQTLIVFDLMFSW